MRALISLLFSGCSSILQVYVKNSDSTIESNEIINSKRFKSSKRKSFPVKSFGMDHVVPIYQEAAKGETVEASDLTLYYLT